MELTMGLLLGFIFQVAVLWVAMKITKVEGTVAGIVVATLAGTGVMVAVAVGGTMIIGPVAVLLGMAAGAITQCVLLSRFTGADLFPDIVLMVFVANIISALVS